MGRTNLPQLFLEEGWPYQKGEWDGDTEEPDLQDN